jgi:DNA-binding NtrC family response regulator
VKARILLVDDEDSIRFPVKSYLTTQGYRVDEAASCAEALAVFQREPPDLAVLDHLLPDGSGAELVARLRSVDERVPLVMLTGHGSIDLAVRAVKEGAAHFLTKPVELATLLVVLERTLDDSRNRRLQDATRREVRTRELDPFIGASPAIRALETEARRLLTSDSPVLIQGPTGAGKSVLAAWLHQHGDRADEAFVDLNCAGLSREFLDSELFGHERGAFTGAVAPKRGLLDVAHRGTLFLDEIGDIDPALQPKLLKVLEEKRFRRLGDVRDVVVDVRIVVATNHDLGRQVREGGFRADLYFRVNTFKLSIPPLRERPEDVPLLARRLLGDLGRKLRRPGLTLSDDALAAMRGYAWPGNLRELRNVLEQALMRVDGAEIRAQHLRFEAEVEPVAAAAALTLAEVERRHIELVLAQEKGRVEPAAARLGIPRSTLYQKLKRLGLVGKVD